MRAPVFWDADTWMFPTLLQFAPELAKSVVEYRYKTLPATQANAQQLGYRGAFYPLDQRQPRRHSRMPQLASPALPHPDPPARRPLGEWRLVFKPEKR
jgi:trehalose/maltose hydrolase-like predicted phosphorylase